MDSTKRLLRTAFSIPTIIALSWVVGTITGVILFFLVLSSGEPMIEDSERRGVGE